ncbi:hypothetical protein DNH61_16435 [Paenibacillus sambharensis]|uniref:Uncharacterized protein n=1 Tax=Paenibacillus sambharensis TaxID=1803190 RepID=A0A2W1LHX6_9BACL|nr:hypothetical protein [Paenibacillus sambharensis]PZD94555.1 hypothetical protein DNH61_16435 [Paenibacillus sambharensis]
MENGMQSWPDSETEARALFEANPDYVFEPRLTLHIEPEAAGFWISFSSEWGGALYLMDETNRKRYENGMIGEQHYEYAKRSYRLGLIRLTELHDSLAAWQSESGQGSYSFRMHTLDCFFIPAYLQDYAKMHPGRKEQCGQIVQLIRDKLSEDGTLEEKARSIEVLAATYIRHLQDLANQS